MVVGLAFLTGAAYFAQMGAPEFVHTATQISAAEVPQEAEMQNFSGLSPRGQDVFQGVVASDGEYVVTGRDARPDDFVYTDAPALNRGTRIIRYDGSYYRLQTYYGGTAPGIVVVGGSLVSGVIGVVSVLAGWRSLRTGDIRPTRALWIGFGSLVAILILRMILLSVSTGRLQLVPVDTAFVATVVGVPAAVSLYSYLRSRTI